MDGGKEDGNMRISQRVSLLLERYLDIMVSLNADTQYKILDHSKLKKEDDTSHSFFCV